MCQGEKGEKPSKFSLLMFKIDPYWAVTLSEIAMTKVLYSVTLRTVIPVISDVFFALSRQE